MSADAALSRSAAATRKLRMVGADHAGERHADDFYPTPPEVTRALLKVETFYGPIWEPACGDGAMSRELEAAGYVVESSDLVDRGFGQSRVDFLIEHQPRAPNIVTNPPFKLGEQFWRHACHLATGKVVFFCRLTWLEGAARAVMFSEVPPSRVWVMSKRPTFTRGGGEKTHGGGMLAFAWFVRDPKHTGRPEIGWLP